MRPILAFLFLSSLLVAQADTKSLVVVPDDRSDVKWVRAQRIPERYAPRKWQESTNGIACALTASKDTVAVGEAIMLQVFFKNTSNHPFRFIEGMKVRGEIYFPLTIQGPAGKLQFKGKDTGLYGLTMTTLKAGEVLRFQCRVNPATWGISQVGRYSISLEFPFHDVPGEDDVPGWEGTIRFNALEVTVR